LSRLAGRGQKQNWGAMAADAFGNALASEVIKLGNKPQTTSPAKQVNKSTADIFDGRQLLASNDPLPSFMGYLGSGSGGIIDASGMSYEKTMSLLRMKGSSTMVPESFADIDREMAIEDAGWADIDRAMAFEDSPPIDEIIVTGIRPKGLGPVYGAGGYVHPSNGYPNLVNTDWVRDTINRHQRPMIYPNPVITKPVALSQSSKAFSSAASASSVGSLNDNDGKYKTLTGKYGTLHDYGDYIVHSDIDLFNGSNAVLSSLNTKHECYAVGDGFGLPSTDRIAASLKLTDFGGEIPDKTVFATFVKNAKGELVYPSSRTGVTNVSGHLFVYDAKSGGYSAIDNSVTVYHQYKSGRGPSPDVIFQDVIKNRVSSGSLANNLDSYYAVKLK
jgi:hypothetical protein